MLRLRQQSITEHQDQSSQDASKIIDRLDDLERKHHHDDIPGDEDWAGTPPSTIGFADRRISPPGIPGGGGNGCARRRPLTQTRA